MNSVFRFSVLLCVSFGLSLVDMMALAGPCDPPASSRVLVVQSVDRTLGLRLSDGRTVFLAGLVQKPALRPVIQAYLSEKRATHHTLAVRLLSGKADRHGRLPALVYHDGVLMQHALIRAGQAFFWRTAGVSARCLTALQQTDALTMTRFLKRTRMQEQTAMSLPAGAPRPALVQGSAILGADSAMLLARKGRFTRVYGRIVSVGVRKNAVFLNFGKDWSRDFTVRLRRSVAKRLLGRDRVQAIVAAARKGMGKTEVTAMNLPDLQALGGHWVFVRGWLKIRNGAWLDISDPLHISFPDGL